MARLLNPADFGLVAVANVALRFLSYFSQMGIAPALIQKPSLTDGDVRAALSLSLGVSVLFFLLAIASAKFVQDFFDIKDLTPVIQALALNFLIAGFSSVQIGLIKRKRKFKALALTEMVSYAVGYGAVGLTAAFHGAGVWSLVTAFLSQSLLTAFIAYSIVRPPLALRHTKEQRRHFIGFGGRYSIIGFIEFLTANIDSLLVGKFMGATTTGYYNRALAIANLPVRQPTRILTQTLFPIMSSLSEQHDKQATSVQLGALAVGSYAFSVGIGLSIAAPDIVRVLLGNKWLESIPILQVFAWAIGPQYVANVMGVTLDSMAQLTTKLRIQTGVILLLLVLMLFAARSAVASNIAFAVVIAGWARLCIMSLVLIRLLKIRASDSLRIAASVAVVTTASAIMVYVAAHLVFGDFSVITRLIGEIFFGAIGLTAGLLFARAIVSSHPAVLYLAERMPRLAKLLRIRTRSEAR